MTQNFNEKSGSIRIFRCFYGQTHDSGTADDEAIYFGGLRRDSPRKLSRCRADPRAEIVWSPRGFGPGKIKPANPPTCRKSRSADPPCHATNGESRARRY